MKASFFIVLAVAVYDVSGKRFTMEVENFVAKNKRMARSNASGNFSAHLLLHDKVDIKFCVRKDTWVSIEGIFYSNDGPSDSIIVTLGENDGRLFRTPIYESAGQGWNLFRSSGLVSGNVKLKAGKHSLTLQVTDSDSYGIEIDKLYLSVGDESLEYVDLICTLSCSDDISYNDVQLVDSVPSGTFMQNSKSTSCAEQDNIRVDIFHDSATTFQISSHLPKYVSFANNREPVYDDCVLASPYWNFSNIPISPYQPSIRSQNAKVIISGSNSVVVITIVFNFMRFTRTRELDERLVGSILRLRLRNLPKQNASVQVNYRERGRWIRLEKKIFTPFKNDQTWEIVDRAWDIAANNQLQLKIEPGKLQRVVIDTIRLDRRDTEDETFDLYSDQDIVFQGVRLGFWHHWDDQPDSMTVELNGKVVKKVDSIRIYSRVPWTGNFAQVFVIFQDGRVRLQSLTPHGLDYVPFGSSVFIGKPKLLNQDDPYAPIRKVTISPVNAHLHIEYANGDKANFALETKHTKTLLTVTDVSFTFDRRRFPIMTFKSMWITDGNADVDHVSVNGVNSRHIYTNEWEKLYGISAFFFRKCISQHNTQAPDIRIQFL